MWHINPHEKNDPQPTEPRLANRCTARSHYGDGAPSAGGLAYAAVTTQVCDTPTCEGDDERNNLMGTQIDNTIYGYGRADTITDIARIDKDVIYAGRGGDVINVKEGTDNPHDADYVRCSDGYDTVYYDRGVDAVVGCELKNPVPP
jgi:hypothetical protein